MGKKSKKKGGKAPNSKGTDIAYESRDLSRLLAAAGPPAAREDPDEGAACWVCLDDDHTNEEPLMRMGCACRGSSGWGHVSCVAKSALELERVLRGEMMICLTCKESFTGQLAVALAEKFLARYRNDPPDTYARNYGLVVLATAYGKSYDLDKSTPLWEEVNQNLLGSSTKADRKLRLLALRYLSVDHNLRGEAKIAVQYKEEALDLARGLHGVDSPEYNAVVNFFTSATGLGTEGEDGKEAREEALPEVNKKIHHAMELSEYGDHKEAVRIAEQALTLSRQQYGSDHPTTQLVKTVVQATRDNLNISQSTGVGTDWPADIQGMNNPLMNGTPVVATRWIPEEEKYVVKVVTVGSDGETLRTLSRMKAKPSNLTFYEGTRVTIRGLISSPDLNGTRGEIDHFDENSGRYAVVIPTKEEPILIKAENCVAKFCPN